MPERTISLFNGANVLYAGNLNEGDDLDVTKDDSGNFTINVKGAVPQGDVHEVGIGAGNAGGVAKVWPPFTEAQTVSNAESRGVGPDEKIPASERKAASAKDRKGVSAEEAQPADTSGPDTSGETPPESGGKAGTGFSGQVSP